MEGLIFGIFITVCEFIMPRLWELVRLYSTYDFLYALFQSTPLQLTMNTYINCIAGS